jgi:DNA polymerase-1
VQYLEEVYGKGAKYHIPEASVYMRFAVEKALAIRALKEQLLEEIKANDQEQLLEDIELPLASVLAEMEYDGILVDQVKLQELHESIGGKIQGIEEQILELAGTTFNVGSPKQLGEVLFDQMGLPFAKKTKTGYSTSASVLEKLVDHHPIIPLIMEYRTLTKLFSTYVVGLKQSIMDDGKIHTIYRQAFTSTGRLSSVEPNLQNIPIRYEEGREIRKVFVPENKSLIASDYSQIELRVLADLANEEELIRAFKNKEDIHTKTAQLIFGKEEISSLERRQAKAVNFGIIYGQSAWGLSEGININPKDAERFIQAYYKTFPGIKGFMDQVVQDATDKGYAITMFNRRRYLPELSSSVYMQRESGKRNAMNAPIQGSAADIIKIAMVELHKEMKRLNVKSKMLLQIHDELVFDVVEEEEDLMLDVIRRVMEECVELKVPLKVESNMGANLYETK